MYFITSDPGSILASVINKQFFETPRILLIIPDDIEFWKIEGANNPNGDAMM